MASSKICAINDLRRNFARITAAEHDKARKHDDAAKTHFALDTTLWQGRKEEFASAIDPPVRPRLGKFFKFVTPMQIVSATFLAAVKLSLC